LPSLEERLRWEGRYSREVALRILLAWSCGYYWDNFGKLRQLFPPSPQQTIKLDISKSDSCERLSTMGESIIEPAKDYELTLGAFIKKRAGLVGSAAAAAASRSR